MFKKKCPICGSTKIKESKGGFTIYPELGKPAWFCTNCRSLFSNEKDKIQ